MRSKLRCVTALTVIGLVAGCAGTISPVSSRDKDTSGTYDGTWVARHVHTTDTQTYQDWRFSCSKPMDAIALTVAQGVIKPANTKTRLETFVSSTGRFRLEVPLRAKASESGGSDFSIDDGKMTIILSGNLAESKRRGKMVLGVSQFGNSGCTSKFVFEREQS